MSAKHTTGTLVSLPQVPEDNLDAAAPLLTRVDEFGATSVVASEAELAPPAIFENVGVAEGVAFDGWVAMPCFTWCQHGPAQNCFNWPMAY